MAGMGAQRVQHGAGRWRALCGGCSCSSAAACRNRPLCVHPMCPLAVAARAVNTDLVAPPQAPGSELDPMAAVPSIPPAQRTPSQSQGEEAEEQQVWPGRE